MTRFASTATALAFGGAVASAALVVTGVEPEFQGLALIHKPLDENTNAILLGDASSSLRDTVRLEGSQLYFGMSIFRGKPVDDDG